MTTSQVREPIEPYIRDDVPPQAASVVIRGGPIAPEKLVEHSLRQAREYSFAASPMFSVSVSLTMPGWSIEEILAGPMASRTTVAMSTAGRVQGAGYRLVATHAAPHFDLVLPSANYAETVRLLALFGPPQSNPYKQRRRQQ